MRDPAPSRAAYRLNRLLLTPRFRLFLRYVLPLLVVAAVSAAWIADAGRREDLATRIAEIRRQIEERPEFMVGMMKVEGASRAIEDEVRELFPIDFPLSSFDLDLEAMRIRIAELDAVADVSVRVAAGGVLAVEIDERVPAVVWRSRSGLVLLDGSGHRVADLGRRGERGDLPLVLGAGADRHVSEALALLDIAEPLEGRVRGLLRVGERRWDLLLDRGQRILLPEAAPSVALQKVIALDAAQDLLARDVAVIDFRTPTRPVIRLSETSLESLRQMELTLTGETSR